MRVLSILAVVTAMATPAVAQTPSGTCAVTVSDDAGAPLTVRMHIRTPQGDIVEPPNVFFRRDYFVVNGSVDLDLPPGRFRYEIEHGPEFSAANGMFDILAGSRSIVHVTLRRLADLAAEGWWSGDLHIHRDLEDIPLLTTAEDLHVAPVITWWNAKSKWDTSPLPEQLLQILDGPRVIHAMAGEDERNGGALLYFHLPEPLPITEAEREYPSPVEFARMARTTEGAHIDIEKPFWWDVPTWLALGIGDTIGLANNHMCRASMYESEAWGKPRDTERLPPPRGNGFWTQEIYYHILNAGLRIPPSAGSAAGVLPNPIGYDRVYVHIDGPLTDDAWWDNLRAGHSFVTNGPLLRVRADGELPGYEFASSGAIPISAHVTTRDPVSALEIISNGAVVQTIPVHANDEVIQTNFKPESDGWFLIRAIADVHHTFRFASTAPYYLRTPGKPPHISRVSCQFFLDWVRERMARIEIDDPAKRTEVLAYHRQAEAFWQERLQAATAD